MLILFLACSTPPASKSSSDFSRPAMGDTDDAGTGVPTDGEESDDGRDETEAPPDAYARIVYPSNGAVVSNPVTFEVDFSEVSSLELYADEWRLGSLLPSGALTYTFSEVDRPRVITLRGQDADGVSIGATTITITPTNGDTDPEFTAVPYFYQYDNLYSPASTCGLTSAAMMLGARGSTRTPDDLFLIYGKPQGQSPEGLAELYEREGLEADFGRSATREMLRSMLDDGDPVVVHGFWTAAGHIAVLTGYDEEGWIANDPAGNWAVGYGLGSGEGVRYPYGGGWDMGLSVDGDIWWSTGR